MEAIIAVLGALGVIFAIVANTTTIANHLEARRQKRRAAEAALDAQALKPDGVDTLGRDVAEPASGPADGRPARPRIRTPDQRLRVFVSSTLVELAEERAAARGAIEGLRLTPVLFELGARPHAARDLYRAYLEQSDVFVAIYGHRYGWVAPGEQVSGLEDEYHLAAGHPKLVYLKRQEGEREPRLEALLQRVRSDDQVSYRAFGDADELAELLADDLATLLSERFEATQAGQEDSAFAPVPTAWGPLVGRDVELRRACDLLREPGVRLVTLLGPGGIGKSRLALEVAQQLQRPVGRSQALPQVAADGVAFVGLQGVREASGVPLAIAQALGMSVREGRDPMAALKDFLGPRELLLVLDNFEQLLDAAPLLSELLEVAPGLKMLVTSRALLRLSAERAVPLSTLPVPERLEEAPSERLRQARSNAAVQLFVWRARALLPDLQLDERNAGVLLDVARRLDGWPLAIVLAASRVGHMSLEQLRDRLERRLDVLVGGARDMPERQRTLRATIEWSLEILGADARRLLTWLSVFVGGATLESVERLSGMLGAERGEDVVAALQRPLADGLRTGVVDLLAELVDHSLLQRVETLNGPRYLMLEMIREAAAAELDEAGEREAVEMAHALVFVEMAMSVGPAALAGRELLYGALQQESPNVRAAVDVVLERGDLRVAARMAAGLWYTWWEQGQVPERMPWLDQVLARDDLGPYERACFLFSAAGMSLLSADVERAERLLDEGEAGFAQFFGARGQVMTDLGRSIIAAHRRDLPVAAAAAERARAKATEIGFRWARAFSTTSLARVAMGGGRFQEAVRLSREVVEMAIVAGDRHSEGWARLAGGIAQAMLVQPPTQRSVDREAGATPDIVEATAGVAASLRIFSSLGAHALTVTALLGAAMVAGRAGEEERAVRLTAAAEEARQHYGVATFEPDISILRREAAALRERVEPASWAALWEEGSRMPIDVAVHYAIGGAEPLG